MRVKIKPKTSLKFCIKDVIRVDGVRFYPFCDPLCLPLYHLESALREKKWNKNPSSLRLCSQHPEEQTALVTKRCRWSWADHRTSQCMITTQASSAPNQNQNVRQWRGFLCHWWCWALSSYKIHTGPSCVCTRPLPHICCHLLNCQDWLLVCRLPSQQWHKKWMHRWLHLLYIWHKLLEKDYNFRLWASIFEGPLCMWVMI